MGRDQSSATRRENTQPTHTKTGKHSIHHFFYHLQPEDKMLSQLTPKQEKTAFIISFDSPTTSHMDHAIKAGMNVKLDRIVILRV